MKTANNIFRIFFLIMAIAEAIGFLMGNNHCLWAALACYAISRIFIIDSIQSKEYSKLKERRATWYKQGKSLKQAVKRY